MLLLLLLLLVGHRRMAHGPQHVHQLLQLQHRIGPMFNPRLNSPSGALFPGSPRLALLVHSALLATLRDTRLFQEGERPAKMLSSPLKPSERLQHYPPFLPLCNHCS
jgi:hypothetical protein